MTDFADRLRELSKAATPAPWTLRPSDRGSYPQHIVGNDWGLSAYGAEAVTPFFTFSMIDTWLRCQQRYAYSYRMLLEPERLPGPMDLGLKLHECVEAFYTGRAEEIPELVEKWEPTREQDKDVAAWLMARYVEHYAADLGTTKVVATEVPIRVELPSGRILQGHADRVIVQLYDRGGQVGLVETKSMGDWSRLDALLFDRQLNIYWYGLQRMGFKLDFALYDAIYTRKWVNPRPLADSFQRVRLDRTHRQIDAMLVEVEEACRQIERFDAEEATPVPHVVYYGPYACKNCPFWRPCEEKMKGYPEEEQAILAEEYRRKEGVIR